MYKSLLIVYDVFENLGVNAFEGFKVTAVNFAISFVGGVHFSQKIIKIFINMVARFRR